MRGRGQHPEGVVEQLVVGPGTVRRVAAYLQAVLPLIDHGAIAAVA
jgi:hypothetical protein